jgi:hypothetical protein
MRGDISPVHPSRSEKATESICSAWVHSSLHTLFSDGAYLFLNPRLEFKFFLLALPPALSAFSVLLARCFFLSKPLSDFVWYFTFLLTLNFGLNVDTKADLAGKFTVPRAVLCSFTIGGIVG